MRIEEVEVVVVGLELRTPIRSAGLVQRDKTTLFVKVTTEAGSSWGECTAYPGARAPDPTPEEVEQGALDALVRRLVETCDSGVESALDVVAACSPDSVGAQSVAAALEMALLDLELLAARRSLADAVGATRGEVETGLLVGIPEGRDLGRFVEEVERALETPTRRLRIKIEPGWDRLPLEALRERDVEVPVLADANGSYDVRERASLRALDAFGLRCLEQPFAPHELEAHRRLADELATPVGLDESLWSVERVREAVRTGACGVACLKPGRLGGVAATIEAAAACGSAAVDCFVGGFFESGLGRSVNAALAGRPECTLPGDLGDPANYLVANPFRYLPTDGGTVGLSGAPGLGSSLVVELLESRTLRSRRVRLRP